MRRWTFTAAFMGACAILGCGSSGLAPVKGQFVTPDGKPATALEKCSVVFEGKAADGTATGSTGEIDAEGRFELTTLQPGDGAPIGTHKVSIAAYWPGAAESPKPLPVLDKYSNPETSGLTADVKPGANDIKLTIELKPTRGKTP
ncbi:hypothetical protein [Tuwongella immobilis]|uniref:Carboxypeptidase regulatory-like domain-containing protein n=1 Tax=Tuwongella immobilis TaxID=692036 RepID=A0A6C2YR24_9BACT|nr:hypothetical protein [Tuwongella immobilis]VIP03807.1 Uncharacterized protein OS=Pirellula staleyi (strain ATCC 27377 / DSM 6068 / ICPB 4128) GN=Psta_1880 PE=4 SV=1 [Tuwongella immobilis]VTS04981.1 Uncharacterized protein OS=Pirellula staleyi (strain ATCC 27377 / DSM 6068 / ICPB 4128) GN=Psta_1880 PE=4 SV=1 [Tuwongella immobilis]